MSVGNSDDADPGNNAPNPKTIASWGGIGGGMLGGLAGLFAAASHSDTTVLSAGFWTMVGAALLGVLTAGSSFLVAYLNNATKMQKEIGDLRDQISKLREKSDLEISTLRTKSDADTTELRSKLTDSLLREKDLKYDLERAQKRIDVLETTAGIIHPTLMFGVVIADFNGIIQEFSPSLTPALGYLPEQMRGESIEKLIPAEYMEGYTVRFKESIKPGMTVDPTKRINTYALDKNGHRVPVSISLRKWVGDTKLITATIVIRPSASAGNNSNTPKRRSTDIE